MLLLQFHRDILYLIFAYVNFETIGNVRLTCKRFRNLVTIPWIESIYMIYYKNTYDECSILPVLGQVPDGTTPIPNKLRHGMTITYSGYGNSNEMKVYQMISYRFGRLDGPFWLFAEPDGPSESLNSPYMIVHMPHRKDMLHGIHAIWTRLYDTTYQLHDTFTTESYYWGRRIPDNQIFNPDTDIYAYRSHGKSSHESWIALSDGGIITQRLGYGNANEYRVCTFNVDTKTSVVEYYDRKGNLIICLEYDMKNNRSTYRSWHKNGILKQSGQYRGGNYNNRRCGVWLRYASNGVLIGSTLYLDKEKVMWHRDTW